METESREARSRAECVERVRQAIEICFMNFGLVVIKGGGDLASGAALRLHRSGFQVVITELPQPLTVRRAVSFGSAVLDGEIIIEGVRARLCADVDAARACIGVGDIAVLIDEDANCIAILKPAIVVDAIMAKRNTGTRISDAPMVVALGPGFTASLDAHAVVETNRGHNLGRVYYHGQAEPDTGIPALVGGDAESRVVRAPADGMFRAVKQIGEQTEAKSLLGYVDGEAVVASTSGVIRGLIADNVRVERGMKIGDVDPRATVEHCFTVSDKSRAVGGGVLEAILYLSRHNGSG